MKLCTRRILTDILTNILRGSCKSLHMSQVAHQARAYPGFCNMKRLLVFLLSPGWDASPSQGYPQHKVRRYPFIHLDGERHCESSVLPKNTTQCPRPGLKPGLLNPETSALTMRPLRLPSGPSGWSLFQFL